MDPKVLYWTCAWLNMLVIAAVALRGIRLVRRREIARHRRHMLSACALVIAFVLSYLVKLALLGREQLETWAATYVYVLRVHELCVLVLVLAGSTAVYLAMRLRLLEASDGSQGAYEGPIRAARLRLHRRAGRTAVGAVLLGLLFAGIVLYGMWSRTGLL